jgi:hypothetical protein
MTGLPLPGGLGVTKLPPGASRRSFDFFCLQGSLGFGFFFASVCVQHENYRMFVTVFL